jgi:hypothetical protein
LSPRQSSFGQTGYTQSTLVLKHCWQDITLAVGKADADGVAIGVLRDCHGGCLGDGCNSARGASDRDSALSDEARIEPYPLQAVKRIHDIVLVILTEVVEPISVRYSVFLPIFSIL